MDKKLHQETLYYALIFLLLLFTAGAALLIMPLMMFGGPIMPLIISAILGLVFGLFLAFFIRELDTITNFHHAGLMAVILVGSVINFGIIYAQASALAAISGLQTDAASPLGVAFVFSLGFLLPYALHLQESKKKAAA